MPISNMPAALQAAIQEGFLEQEFRSGFSSTLGFRSLADREKISIHIGETVTKTRHGLRAPVEEALDPTQNAGLDNGIVPGTWTIEQYTLGINMYGSGIDLNTQTTQVGVANQFLVNAKVLGTQGAQSLDRLARNALFDGYLGGNTRVRVALAAAAATVQVDDIRGFSLALKDGKFQPVSGALTLPVVVGGNLYQVTGVAADAVNVSKAFRGVSGTLTFSGNVAAADATLNAAVVSLRAPKVHIAADRASDAALQAGDILTIGQVADAVTRLRNDTGQPGAVFPLLLSPTSERQLFRDPEFRELYRGRYGGTEISKLSIYELAGAMFVKTTEAPTAPHPVNAGLTVHMPILCHNGVLVEGDFEGVRKQAADKAGENHEIHEVDGVVHVTQGPLDRLAQIIKQSWYWMGGFTTPTDATATSAIIPTASAAYLKRATVLKHV